MNIACIQASCNSRTWAFWKKTTTSITDSIFCSCSTLHLWELTSSQFEIFTHQPNLNLAKFLKLTNKPVLNAGLWKFLLDLYDPIWPSWLFGPSLYSGPRKLQNLESRSYWYHIMVLLGPLDRPFFSFWALFSNVLVTLYIETTKLSSEQLCLSLHSCGVSCLYQDKMGAR